MFTDRKALRPVLMLGAVCSAAAPKKSAGSSKKDTPTTAAGPGPAPGTGAPFLPPVPGDAAEKPAEFKDEDIDVEVAAAINAAGAAGMYALPSDLAPLKFFGYVEVNEATKDGDKVAVRITEAGAKWCLDNVDTGEGADAGAAEPTGGFIIDSGVAMPTTRAFGVGRVGKYPFDKLEIGQSFHIAATKEAPQPNAKYGSAVTSANKRMKEANKPNAFKIRAVGTNDPRGAGARVFRVS